MTHALNEGGGGSAVKITRAHAKKLAKYLENEMGWEVYPSPHYECLKHPLDHHLSTRDGMKFCYQCGAKVVKRDWNDTVRETEDELVAALRAVLK